MNLVADLRCTFPFCYEQAVSWFRWSDWHNHPRFETVCGDHAGLIRSTVSAFVVTKGRIERN